MVWKDELQVLFLTTVRVYDSPQGISPHLHVISMALILCLNTQKYLWTLPLSSLSPESLVRWSLALILTLQGPQSSVLTFLSQFYSTHWDKLNCTKLGNKKTALPNISGCNLGAQNWVNWWGSTLFEGPGSWGKSQCLFSSSTSLFSMPERKVASDWWAWVPGNRTQWPNPPPLPNLSPVPIQRSDCLMLVPEVPLIKNTSN